MDLASLHSSCAGNGAIDVQLPNRVERAMAGQLKDTVWKMAETPPEGCSLSNKSGLKRLLLDEWLYKGTAPHTLLF